MISAGEPRMRIVTTKHTEIAVNHPIAATRKPAIASIALSRSRLADKIRFVAGIAISLVGAGVFLANMARLIPSFD